MFPQNTAKLREAFKDPGTLPALCQLLGTSENAQVWQVDFSIDHSHTHTHWHMKPHVCTPFLYCTHMHGWEITVILRNFRKTKLSKSKIFFFFFKFFFLLYFNIHTMCNSTTFALRHTQISLSGILGHFWPPSRHLLLNTHDTNMEFFQLNGPLLDIFLFFSKTKIFRSHPCICSLMHTTNRNTCIHTA